MTFLTSLAKLSKIDCFKINSKNTLKKELFLVVVANIKFQSAFRVYKRSGLCLISSLIKQPGIIRNKESSWLTVVVLQWLSTANSVEGGKKPKKSFITRDTNGFRELNHKVKSIMGLQQRLGKPWRLEIATWGLLLTCRILARPKLDWFQVRILNYFSIFAMITKQTW